MYQKGMTKSYEKTAFMVLHDILFKQHQLLKEKEKGVTKSHFTQVRQNRKREIGKFFTKKGKRDFMPWQE